MENIMKIKSIFTILVLSICMYEPIQGALPAKGVHRQQLVNEARRVLVEARKWLNPAKLTSDGYNKAKISFNDLQTVAQEIETKSAQPSATTTQLSDLKEELLFKESDFYRRTVEDSITKNKSLIDEGNSAIQASATKTNKVIQQIKENLRKASHTKLKDFFQEQVSKIIPLEAQLTRIEEDSRHIANNAENTLRIQLPEQSKTISGVEWDDIAETIEEIANDLTERLREYYQRVSNIATEIKQINQTPSTKLMEPVKDYEEDVNREDIRVSDPKFIGTYTVTEDQTLHREKLPLLGDQLLETMPPSLQRGLIMGFVMMQSAGMSPVGMNIPDVVNNHKFEGTRKPEILPPTVQAIFNFDATLPRLAIINQITHNAPFMKQPIPGVRRLEINALNPYQYIIEQIEAAPQGCPNAISALQAFVSILLQLYTVQKSASQRWYHLTSANPQNNPILSAIITEANDLVKIAEQHDPSIAKQLQWEVDSHHTWRRYTYYGSRALLGGLASTVGVLGMRYAGTDTLHQAGAGVAGVAGTYVANKAHQHLTN